MSLACQTLARASKCQRPSAALPPPAVVPPSRRARGQQGPFRRGSIKTRGGQLPFPVRADGRGYRYEPKGCHYRCWNRGGDGRRRPGPQGPGRRDLRAGTRAERGRGRRWPVGQRLPGPQGDRAGRWRHAPGWGGCRVRHQATRRGMAVVPALRDHAKALGGRLRQRAPCRTPPPSRRPAGSFGRSPGRALHRDLRRRERRPNACQQHRR